MSAPGRNVGFPESGPKLLEDISKIAISETSLMDWLPAASKYYKDTWSKLNKDRVAQNKQSGLAAPPSDREKQYEILANSTDEVSSSLIYVANNLDENSGSLLEDDLGRYRKWSREFGRYSFGWHLKWVE